MRRAVERTIQSTVGSAAMTRERAQELVDDAVRRAEHEAARAGRGVREAGQRQAEAAAGVGDRLREAILDLRVATREDVRKLVSEIERLAARVDRLDREIRGLKAPKSAARSRPAAKRAPAKGRSAGPKRAARTKAK